MNVSFDPAYIRSCMQLWRDTTSNQVPMATEFQLHFITERPSILRNFECTATAWLMILEKARVGDSDQADLDTLVAEIKEFEAWVKSEIRKLDDLALKTSIEAGVDEIVRTDPALAARLGEYFKKSDGAA